jgi:hypothetical protein
VRRREGSIFGFHLKRSKEQCIALFGRLKMSYILDALGQNGIGKAVSGLLEKEMPQEEQTPEAFCTPEHVHDVLQ